MNLAEDMARQGSLAKVEDIMDDPDNPIWTEGDFARAKPVTGELRDALMRDPTTSRATHLHLPSGAVVFAAGSPPEEIETLPEGYWERVDREAARASIKAEAALRIAALDFPDYAQMNAIREGRMDDPRFAEIDAIRRWSNEEEEKVK